MPDLSSYLTWVEHTVHSKIHANADRVIPSIPCPLCGDKIRVRSSPSTCDICLDVGRLRLSTFGTFHKYTQYLTKIRKL